jgi:hypothetical protein
MTMCMHKPRVSPAHLKVARRQAELLCLGYEDTQECHNAWLRVEHLEKMYNEQQKIDELIRDEMKRKS